MSEQAWSESWKAAEAATPAEPEPEAPAAEAAAEPSPDRKAQLEALAKELGYEVADDRVSVAERKRFRDERRKHKAEVEAARSHLQRESMTVQQLAAAKRAFDSGDLDEALRAAFGIDANEVVKRNLAKIKGEDPRVTELQRRLQAKEAEEAKLREQAASQLQTQRLEQAREKHREELRTAFVAGDDPALKVLGDVRQFVEHVRSVQEAEWDGYSTISDLDAAKKVLREWRETYTVLDRAFRSAPQQTETPRPGARVAAPSESATRKPRITQASASEAGSAPRKPLSHQDWRGKFAALLERATDD